MSRVVLSVICLALVGVVTNVATGALPEGWSPYLWLAWPLLILLVLVLVAVEVLGAREPRGAAPAGAARARRVLLERVRRYWVTSVLDRSLHEEIRIELGVTATADDRRHPWTVRASHRNGFDGVLDARTSMAALFDRLDRAVVILGAPGAGKTTTLLELARDLLDRAEADPEAPIPVVLNLASWATHRRPLARWLVEQLTERYGIPPEQGSAWVDAGEILPLLDGLDEVTGEHRDACARAIADFHAGQPLTPLAVCCRSAEYDRLGTPLPVYGTVTIQPLDRAQIERYVEATELAGLRAALAADPELWDLADSPLLLSIMALAYADGAASLPDAPGSGRQRLFARYVETMLHRRPHPHYPPARITAWLTTLARELRDRGQTVFVLDLIDETWSPRRGRVAVASLLARFANLVVVGAVLGVIAWWLSDPPGRFAAGGMVVLAVILYATHYLDLRLLVYALRREREDLGGFSWLVGSMLSIVYAVRFERSTVATIAGLSTAVGVLSAVAGDPDAPWTAGIGYGSGFFLAAFVTFVAMDSAEMLLFERRPSLAADRHEVPSPLLRHRLRFVLRRLLPLGATTGALVAAAVTMPGGGVADAFRFGALLGVGVMLVVLSLVALTPIAEQWLVRRRLHRRQVVPYPVLPFLGHAVQCLFLRQVGDGYIFVHRELLEHFATGPEPVPHQAATEPAGRPDAAATEPVGPTTEPVAEGRTTG
ncbi:NACHT domain-containing protein [Micromonospora sp. C28SCA-DRY-2]|uniref:NACHT domain-containing protein n=1 Tax=Micromonospora sp. C28SCA-DRY-2 TaxID=3059522 RepID=UPI002674751B|nr:NACHT domain-containing protein [Micromonospora sp. C28SCA-DRY-2]MDO3703603.1 NACHT domain-containing protein [Micromonospora sp. C28SCA-DRY-2]